ncbi:transcriptional regulator [Amycolatopsis antarctica]|uniref:Transcriptional regulator n=1 Tax=Amycolatopsis antarctica TaxID=1854586 RepID=A0A263D9F1_9PSEU|nr:transcriptional regulator [Amycolatopsis antarctica]
MLEDVTGALETLADVLSRENEFGTLLHEVCEQVVRAVPGVEAATVALLEDGTPRTAASTDQEVAGLDEEQYSAAEGPCLEAAHSGKLVRVSLAEAQAQWPSFAKAAHEAGIGSFLSAPLMVDRQVSGAINCYSSQHHGFRELDARLLELYTAAVEAALRSARRFHQALELAEQLRAALRSRAVIDQAKGIVMAVRHIDADQAFTVLVEQSQQENTKLRDLAKRLVAGVTATPR